MLGRIRKFSSSIFAKVFLFIVAIPFIFWGMGDLFRGGNQNTIVKIDEEKITVKELTFRETFISPNGRLIDFCPCILKFSFKGLFCVGTKKLLWSINS